jgi:predicted metal-dependent hydrolase
VPIKPRGEVHQLQEIFEELNERFFRNRVRATITYAQVPRVTQPRKSIKLGSYSSESKVIRIHPALDQPWVPSYFIEWIVYHEMLHHQIPAVVRDGSRCVHTPEFYERERRYPLYEKAKRWEEENLEYLLRYRSAR